MKTFNSKEQIVLRKMIQNTDNFHLYSFLQEDFLSNSVALLEIDNTYYLTYDGLGDKVKEVMSEKRKIIELFLLLKYLEKKNLIGIYDTGGIPLWLIDHERNKRIIKNDDYAVSLFSESDKIHQYLNENLVKNFYLSEELLDIITNNFKTKEEIYIEKQLAESRIQSKLSKYTFILSLITMLISIILTYLS